jgi:hypothetical protein
MLEVPFDHDPLPAIRHRAVRDLQLLLGRLVEPAAHFGDARAGVAVLGGAAGQHGSHGREADEKDVPMIQLALRSQVRAIVA